MFGPSVMALVIAWTGSSRYGILSVIVFFAVGALILYLVDEDEGRRRRARGAGEGPSDSPSAGSPWGG
jgi:MFS transporter, UMF1 family